MIHISTNRANGMKAGHVGWHAIAQTMLSYQTFFELHSKLLTTQKRLPHGSCVHAATNRTHSQVSKIAASLAGGLDRGLALRVVVGLAQDHELVRVVQGEGEGDAP